MHVPATVSLSLALWGLVGTVLFCALSGSASAVKGLGSRTWFWTLLTATAALVLFFRPHEDLLGGQDGGAYLNLGGRFAYQDSIIYTDELLAEMPASARDAFRYTMHGNYPSKFGTEHILDPEASVIAPWFQPAYPLLISLPARMISPRWLLYVVPVFAWLNGILIAGVIWNLYGNRMVAAGSALLYVLTPLVVWHGRGPRPEFIACSLILSAVILLMRSRGSSGRMETGLAAGTALALAPFFHIMAWNAALAGAMYGVIRCLSGSDRLRMFFLPLAIGVNLFIWQLLLGIDTYHLSRFIRPLAPGGSPLFLFMATTLIAVGFPIIARRISSSAQSGQPGAVQPRTRILRMAGMGLFLLGMTLWAACTRPHTGIHYVKEYVNRTDLVAAADMVSLPWALAGALGLIVMVGEKDRSRFRKSVPLLCVLIPPAFLIGNMYDFFMMRYLVMTWVPLLICSITALLAALMRPVPQRFKPVAMASCMVLLLATALPARFHFLTGREYAGLYEALKKVTARPREEQAVMLVEYSRVGAPVNHIFGLPTLGLNNERISDLQQDTAVQAWTDRMRDNPDTPAYLLTVYDSPVSEFFRLEPVMDVPVEMQLMRSRRWGLPEDLRDWSLRLRLFRIHLPEKESVSDRSLPYIRSMDSGRFGLRGFGFPVIKPWYLHHLASDTDSSYTVSYPEQPAAKGSRLAFFVYSDQPDPSAVIRQGKDIHQTDPVALTPGWTLFSVPLSSLDPSRPILFRPDKPVFLNAVWSVGPHHAELLRPSTNVPESGPVERGAAFGARAATGPATVVVPGGPDPSLMMLFMLLPEETGPALTLQAESGQQSSIRRLPTGRWLWTCWPGLLSAGPQTLEIHPLLQPAQTEVVRRYNFMLGGIAVLPAPSPR